MVGNEFPSNAISRSTTWDVPGLAGEIGLSDSGNQAEHETRECIL